MTRALLYLRQSDSDGEGERSLSMDSQSRILHDDATRRGWIVVGELRDADLKGWDEARKGLSDLKERCRRRDVDMVAFWALDRLARDLRIQENVVHELRQLEVDFFSHEEPWINDDFLRQILGSTNQRRTKEIAANIRRGLRERQNRGLQHGNTPWGYVCPDNKSKLVVDHAAARHVQDIYTWRLEGMGPAAIARRLSDRGILTPTGLSDWRVCSVSRILRTPTYRGAVSIAGAGFIEDAHPAIVPSEIWHAVQELHQGRRRSPRLNKMMTSWLEGLIRHGCGLPMYLIQPYQGRSPYFRCAEANAGIRTARQEQCPVLPRRMNVALAEPAAWLAIERVFATLATDANAVVAEARRRYRESAPGADAVRRAATDRLERAQARRARAEDLYLSGSRDHTWFAAEDARAGSEAAAIERDLAALPQAPDADAIAAAWAEIRALGDALAKIHDDGRRLVLHALGAAIIGDHAVSIRLKPELEPHFPGAYHKAL